MRAILAETAFWMTHVAFSFGKWNVRRSSDAALTLPPQSTNYLVLHHNQK